MTYLAMNVLLALAWGALWGSFAPIDLLGGFLFGYAGLWFSRRLVTHEDEARYFRALPQSIALFFYFIKELVKACLMVARDCIARKPRLHPAIVHLPIGPKSDLEIFILANLITLTPGTLTLDVADDKSFLVIHSIYCADADALIEDLQTGMEQHVRKVFC